MHEYDFVFNSGDWMHVGDRRVGSSHSNSGMRYVRGILTKRG